MPSAPDARIQLRAELQFDTIVAKSATLFTFRGTQIHVADAHFLSLPYVALGRNDSFSVHVTVLLGGFCVGVAAVIHATLQRVQSCSLHTAHPLYPCIKVNVTLLLRRFELD